MSTTTIVPGLPSSLEAAESNTPDAPRVSFDRRHDLDARSDGPTHWLVFVPRPTATPAGRAHTKALTGQAVAPSSRGSNRPFVASPRCFLCRFAALKAR